MILPASLLVTSFTLLSSLAIAGEHHHHDHDHYTEHTHAHHEQNPHEHGVAQMFLTMVDHDVLVEVKSPLYNVVGFEHAPKNQQQQQQLQNQREAIQAGDLIQLDQAAQCQQKSAKIMSATHNQQSEQTGHRDLSFEYQWHCQQPKAIKNINMQRLFQTWPHLQTLRVEWVHQHHQSAMTLQPDTPVIHFE